MHNQTNLFQATPWPQLPISGKPTVVDLFCGVGGFSLGFEQAGFQTRAGVDFDEAALRTFKRNHPQADAIQADLSDEKDLDRLLQCPWASNVDVLLAGPPCQGFSLTGPRNLSDPRNSLYQSALSMAKAIQPTVLLIENVPGLRTLYKGRVLAEIVEHVQDLGYSLATQILTAADFGVPQLRRRLFILAVKGEGVEVDFPQPTHDARTHVGCEDAIGDLPSLEDSLGQDEASYASPPKSEYQSKMRGSETVLRNHVATRHSEKVRSVIRLVPEGGNHKDLPAGVGEHRRFNEAWTRYHSKLPSKTIDTGHRNHFHYRWDRVPTVRENARLQSFPDSFIFEGSKTQQSRQVGNAVPPLLAENIARHLIRRMTRDEDQGSQ